MVLDFIYAVGNFIYDFNLAYRFIIPWIIWSIFLVILAAFLVQTFIFPEPRRPIQSEKTFKTLSEDGTVTEPEQLPCWQDRNVEKYRAAQKEGRTFQIEKYVDPAELFMTVVVPAYNEEKRLTGMLEEAVNYLETEYGLSKVPAHEAGGKSTGEVRERRKTQDNEAALAVSSARAARGWELLVIDDGSSDLTVETALAFARAHQLPLRPRRLSGPWTHGTEQAVNIPVGSIRVVSLVQNRGKGGAVIHGMRHARGQYIVFADADGASRFDDLGKLVSACKRAEDAEGRAVAVGSRAHLVGSEAVVKRTKFRNFLMHSFHLLLKWMTPKKTAAIRDTQCGFKLFSRPTLPYIIPYMHCEGWIFDVEMLMLAEYAGIPVVEVPVGWQEVQGSKLNVLKDSLGMAFGLARLRIGWGSGAYTRMDS